MFSRLLDEQDHSWLKNRRSQGKASTAGISMMRMNMVFADVNAHAQFLRI